MTYPSTPEHDKLRSVAGDTQKLGAFLEWLAADGVVLARHHHHGAGCYEVEDRGIAGVRIHLTCELAEDDLMPDYETIQKRLARYVGIDLEKLEEEKRALLDYQRTLNEQPQ
ncbi:hypothetical protein Rctr197k_163 [Virus Rctr197k]|nr:hypothetical protein Rctr197k_163 [Virus Rctr197k]